LFTPAPAHRRHAHYPFAAALYGILGFHVGVWAVQLGPLSAGLRLDPAALGAAVTVAASAGLVTLFAGGTLADRVGRRPVLAIGFTGTGTALVLLALAGAIGSAAALRAGIGYRGVYLALAAVMAAGLVAALLAAIPAPPGGSPTGSPGRGQQPSARSGGSPPCYSPSR
jgi:MFS family permease